jgi:hypothetical protein
MRRAVLAIVPFYLLCLFLTPPGLCPCWLMFDPAAHHPHFDGHAERPHSHEYLLDYFQSQTVGAAPVASLPAASLIALQAASGLRRPLAVACQSAGGWTAAPLTPPPERVWVSAIVT